MQLNIKSPLKNFTAARQRQRSQLLGNQSESSEAAFVIERSCNQQLFLILHQ